MDRSFILQQVSVKIALFIDRAHTLSNVSIKTPALWTGPNFSINIHKTAPFYGQSLHYGLNT